MKGRKLIFTLLSLAVVFAGCKNTVDDGVKEKGVNNGNIAAMYSKPIEVPKEVKATLGTYTDKVVISWGAVVGATAFEVFRADDKGEDAEYFLADFKSLGKKVAVYTFDDTKAEPDKHYFYKVKAYDRDDNGTGLSEVQAEGFVKSAEALPAVSEMKIPVATADSIKLGWTAVSGAKFYNIYRRELFETEPGSGEYAEGEGSVWEAVIKFLEVTAFEDRSVMPGSVYEYYISALDEAKENESAESEATKVVQGTLAIPSNVKCSEGDASRKDRILVSWDPIANVSYNVYRRDAKIKGDFIRVTTGLTETSWEDSLDKVTFLPEAENDLEVRCSLYEYKIAAVNSDGLEGVRSFSAKGFAMPSEAAWEIELLNISQGDLNHKNTIEVTWDFDRNGVPLQDVSKIVVYRADTADSFYDVVGSAKPEEDKNGVLQLATSFVQNADAGDISLGNTYFYRVSAFCLIDGYSEPFEGQRTAPMSGMTLAPPSEVSTILDGSDVLVKWKVAEGVDEYVVERSSYNADDPSARLYKHLKELQASADEEGFQTFRDDSAELGAKYYYVVTAKAGTSVSAMSAESLCYTLTTPVLVSDPAKLYAAKVLLEWAEPADEGGTLGDAKTYKIYKRVAGEEEFAFLADAKPGDKAYEDQAVEVGVTYEYRMTAFYEGDKESSPSEAVSQYLLAPVTGLVGSEASSKTAIYFSWPKVRGATKYHAYKMMAAYYDGVYEVTEELPKDPTATVTTEEFVIENLVSGDAYACQVIAASDVDVTVYSEIVFGRCSGVDDLEAPLFTSVTDIFADGITLTWEKPDYLNANPTATYKFEVIRSETASASYEQSTVVGNVDALLTRTDIPPVRGKDYFYRVRCISPELGTSAFSPVVVRRLLGDVADVNVTPLPGGGSGVKVSWSEVEGAESYAVLKRNDDGSYPDVAGVAETTDLFSDQVAAAGDAGKEFSFKVLAKGAGGNWTPLGSAQEAVGVFYPAPANVEASQGTNTQYVTVSWDNDPQMAYYWLFRKREGSADSWERQNSDILHAEHADGDRVTYEDLAFAGTIYEYRVVGFTPDEDQTPYSTPVIGFALGAPDSVTKAPVVSDGVSDPSIGLTINDDQAAYIGGDVTYIVKRKLSASAGDPVDIVHGGGAANEYSDANNVKPNHEYCYEISAHYVKGAIDVTSDPLAVTAKVDFSKPKLVNLGSNDGVDPNGIQVAWEAVPGAEGYIVFRSDAKDGDYTEVGSTEGALTYTDEFSEFNIKYYKVKATNGISGDSPSDYSSKYDRGYNQPKPCSFVSAEDGKTLDKIKVSWGTVPNVDGYKITRTDTGVGGTSTVIEEFVPAQSGTQQSYEDNGLNNQFKKFDYQVQPVIKRTVDEDNINIEGALDKNDTGYMAIRPQQLIALVNLYISRALSVVKPANENDYRTSHESSGDGAYYQQLRLFWLGDGSLRRQILVLDDWSFQGLTFNTGLSAKTTLSGLYPTGHAMAGKHKQTLVPWPENDNDYPNNDWGFGTDGGDKDHTVSQDDMRLNIAWVDSRGGGGGDYGVLQGTVSFTGMYSGNISYTLCRSASDEKYKAGYWADPSTDEDFGDIGNGDTKETYGSRIQSETFQNSLTDDLRKYGSFEYNFSDSDDAVIGTKSGTMFYWVKDAPDKNAVRKIVEPRWGEAGCQNISSWEPYS